MAMILFSAVFLAGSLLPLVARAMSFEERRLANGSLGFSIGSPSLDRHLWAAQCGYLAGPGLVSLGPGFVSMFAWLATLYVGVVVPAFQIRRCEESEEGASRDCDMLKALVGSVFSSELTEGSLNSRFPHFGTVLFSMILSDMVSLSGSSTAGGIAIYSSVQGYPTMLGPCNLLYCICAMLMCLWCIDIIPGCVSLFMG